MEIVAIFLSELFSELEDCDKNEQKRNIERMNEIMEEMDEKELKLIFTKEFFDAMDKMIDKEKFSIESAILLLKHMGYNKEMKNIWSLHFEKSQLRIRIEKLIYDENEKKEEKDEKLFIELCVCYLLIGFRFQPALLRICMPCLLNVALNKEKSEKTQKEVEVALLALSKIMVLKKIEKDRYLNEIKEVIKYHQVYRNLTRLAYQSAWEFLNKRFFKEKELEDLIENELQFAKEAERELEELIENGDFQKKKEEKRGKEKKNIAIAKRWMDTIQYFFFGCTFKEERFVELITCMTRLYKEAKENNREIIMKYCFTFLKIIKQQSSLYVFNDFLKGGVIDSFLEEIYHSTIEDDIKYECLLFFLTLSKRLTENTIEDDDYKEWMKVKRMIFEKMEEEGFEDAITCFHEKFFYLNGTHGNELSLNISDYFVNV